MDDPIKHLLGTFKIQDKIPAATTLANIRPPFLEQFVLGNLQK